MAKTALCIGVNNYPGTHMDLHGCVNDAEDWSAELASRGFTVTKLIDAQATKAAMSAGFETIVTGAKKDDVVVITFSGHGTYVPDLNGDEPTAWTKACARMTSRPAAGPCWTTRSTRSSRRARLVCAWC